MRTKDNTSREKATAATPRAVMYVDNLTKGMSKKDAALEAGYSESVANNAKNDIENQTVVQKLLTEAGITHESLVQKLREGMEADKPYGKDGDIHPDYKTRHQYMTTGFRLLGVETEKPAAQINTQINLNETPENIQNINEAFTTFITKFFGQTKLPQSGEEK